MRPSREDVMMEMARIIATRGTCDRKQVGAVIEHHGRPISVGYNGAPPGLPHCDENDHGWKEEAIRGSAGSGYKTRLKILLDKDGCRNATHAEANALSFAAKYGISTEGARLFVTLAPCEVCARLIVAAGIVEVCYLEAYRDESGLELLKRTIRVSTFTE